MLVRQRSQRKTIRVLNLLDHEEPHVRILLHPRPTGANSTDNRPHDGEVVHCNGPTFEFPIRPVGQLQVCREARVSYPLMHGCIMIHAPERIGVERG